MREIRLYGSEGGEAKAFPTPIIMVEPLMFKCKNHTTLGQALFFIFECNFSLNALSLIRPSASF